MAHYHSPWGLRRAGRASVRFRVSDFNLFVTKFSRQLRSLLQIPACAGMMDEFVRKVSVYSCKVVLSQCDVSALIFSISSGSSASRFILRTPFGAFFPALVYAVLYCRRIDDAQWSTRELFWPYVTTVQTAKYVTTAKSH